MILLLKNPEQSNEVPNIILVNICYKKTHKPLPNCPKNDGNRAYSYCHYWPETSLQGGGSCEGNIIKISLKRNERHFLLEKTPRISFGCKLVPVLYREYECGLFEKTRNVFFSLVSEQCKCCAAWHYEHKWWNRELTPKCKLKCNVKPMKDPLGVSPSKGNQGTTRGKEKFTT